MEFIKCVNCKEGIMVKEIKKNMIITCECGCQMKCLDKNDYISNWRVINPFSFKDLRKKIK